MNTICKRILWAATLTGGLLTATAGAASASDSPLGHLLGGSSGTEIRVDLPVATVTADLGGASKPAVSVDVEPHHTRSHHEQAHHPQSDSTQSDRTRSHHHEAPARAVRSVDVSPDVKIPVHIDGVAAGVLGDAKASDRGAEPTATRAETTTRHHRPASTGKESLVGDVTVAPAVAVPVNLCGIAAGVLGDASAQCAGTTSSGSSGSTPSSTAPSSGPGLLGDVDVSPVLTVPLDVCGIGVRVLGDASASCGSGTTVTTPPSTDPPTTTPPTTTPPVTTTPGESTPGAPTTGGTTPEGSTPTGTTPEATVPTGTTPSTASTVPSAGSPSATAGDDGSAADRSTNADVCLDARMMTAGIGGQGGTNQLLMLLGAALGAFLLGFGVRRTPKAARV